MQSSVMPFSTFKEHNPPPLPVGKRSEEEKGSADKPFLGAAKDSSEQVGFGDGSFCNSERDFFPIFIKTTQLPIFIPLNQGTDPSTARLIFEGNLAVYHINPLLISVFSFPGPSRSPCCSL